MRYGTKWPQYRTQWDQMLIRPNRVQELTAYAQFAVAEKKIYFDVEAATGVKWYHVAVLHRRESDANFGTYLGNGDSLKRKTTHVPRGRGPFKTFQLGAIDALKLDGLSSVKDWTIEKILYYSEIFNGTGYDAHKKPSPYLWGATNIQTAGKYVADGVWSASAWDNQPGCAAILFLIAKLDTSVQFVRET
jgi:lysozyme family protein